VEHVDQLGKLVDRRAPQERADAGNPRVGGDFEHPRVPVLVHVEMGDVGPSVLHAQIHRPELVDVERLAVLAAAILPEEDRSARVDLDRDGDGEEERREQDEA